MTPRRYSRRRMLQSSSIAALGAGLAFTGVGCGGDDDDDDDDGSNGANGGTDGGTDGTPDSGSDSQTDSGDPQTGGTFRVAFTSEPPDWDGTTKYTVSIHRNLSYMFNRLVRWGWGPDTNPASIAIEGDLATDWEQPDDTTFVFNLRENAAFHDREPVNGRTLTSEDVVATFERILDPSTNSQLAGKFLDVDSIEAPDESTVRFTLSQPNAEFMNSAAFHYYWIHPSESIASPTELETNPIGTGPWMLQDFSRGERIAFEKNPNYWDEGKPYGDNVEALLIVDQSSQISSFAAGQLDLLEELNAENRDALQGQMSELEFHDYASWVTRRLQITPTRPPLDDPRVRLAILKLIDQEQIINVVFREGTFVGPIPWQYGPFGLPEEEARELLAIDQQEAKQLLDAAGFDFDQTLEISWNRAYGTQYESAGQLIQQQLDTVGIKTNIVSYEYAEYLERWQDPWDKNQLAPAPATGNSPDLLYTLYHPKGDYYFSGHQDEKLAQMAEEQRRYLDPEERASFTHEVQRYLLTENVINVPLGHPNSYWTKQTALKDFWHHNSFGHVGLQDAWKSS